MTQQSVHGKHDRFRMLYDVSYEAPFQDQFDRITTSNSADATSPNDASHGSQNLHYRYIPKASFNPSAPHLHEWRFGDIYLPSSASPSWQSYAASFHEDVTANTQAQADESKRTSSDALKSKLVRRWSRNYDNTAEGVADRDGAAGSSIPIVVHVHGGGWQRGSKRNEVCTRLALACMHTSIQ